MLIFLKIGTHNYSNEFYNLTLLFYSLLQTTRLHSKTLIDNILFNSYEYHQAVSGNLVTLLKF